MSRKTGPLAFRGEPLEDRLLLASDVLASLVQTGPTLSSRPENLVHAGPYTYFDARSDTAFPDCDRCESTFAGREIFRTDGALDRTVSILGRPGRLDAAQALGERLIFVSGETLYASSGTPGETVELMHAPPGQGASDLFRVGRTVLWIARDEAGNLANIFSTDGITVEQVELPFSNSQPQLLGTLNEAVWFLDNELLWSINQTGERTLRGTAPNIQNIGPAAEFIDGSNDRLFFEAETPPLEGGGSTRGLWRLIGRRQGGLPSGISFVAPVTGISDQVVIDQWVYFTSRSEGHGRELWRAPIAGSGAELIFDAAEGPASSNPEFLTEFNGRLLFSAAGKLFVHDPGDREAAPVTNVVRQFNSQPTSFGPRWLTVWNDLVYFVADDGQGEELWSSDGTTGGTRLVADIAPGPLSSSPNWLTPAGNQLHFAAYTATHGIEPWAVNREGNTRQIEDIRQERFQLGRFVSELTQFKEAIYFRLNDTVHGSELWRSDGTATGTRLVKDIYPGANGGSPRELFVLGDWMYFAANDGLHGYELWRTDGTEAGTSLVVDIWPGSEHGVPTSFLDVDGELWFAANDGTAGEEFWMSDGTAAGTTLLAETDEPRLSVGKIIAVDDRFYFWDGTDIPARLWQLRDQGSRLLDRAVFSQAAVNGYLFYVSGDGGGILKTEGGPPVLVARIAEEQDTNKVLAVFNGEMYYTRSGAVFKSDGPSDGEPTALTEQFDGAVAIDAIAASEKYLFGWHLLRASTQATIWSLDQSGEVSLLIDDRSKSLLNLEADAGGLFFSLRDSTGAIEIWTSDGTVQGTRQVDELETADPPSEFQRVGDRLFFKAEDSLSRETVWSTSLAVVGDLNGDSLITADDVDALFAVASSGEHDERFDLNDDQQVDEEDVRFLVVEIAGSRLGDFDLNGRVDFGDFLQLSANFDKSRVGYAGGDANADRIVDFNDFLVLSANFGFEDQV